MSLGKGFRGHTTYSSLGFERKNGRFPLRLVIQGRSMPSFDSNNRFETEERQANGEAGSLAPDNDLMLEQILENMYATPIGRVLRKIASLPEVRREKILDVRRQLTEGRYDLNERLDIAIDKVLEKFTT